LVDQRLSDTKFRQRLAEEFNDGIDMDA